MSFYSRTYNVAAGVLKFDYTYAGIVSGGDFDDFDVKRIGKLNYGYDNDNDIDISIYPSNIDITIDDLTGDNYTRFSKLIKSYSITYPYNIDTALRLEIFLNGKSIFEGFLDDLESDKDNWELTLSFVDGVNKYKNVNIGNPLLLKNLWDNNVINGKRYGAYNTIAYGFSTVGYVTYASEPERSGYYVNSIHNGDRDTNLVHTISRLFKILNENIEVEFDIQYLFKDIYVGSETVDISRVFIRRILSNLIGRYVAIKKGEHPNERMAYLNDNPDYTREQYFEVVYEDSEYKVFRHTFSGSVGSLVWQKGTDIKNVGELLKLFAYNFFSYFGFKEDKNKVFFRHRRYTSDPVLLTDIRKMSKVLSVDRVEGVKIDDYYSDNYATDGNNYGTSDHRTINYKIPFNAIKTTNAYEYRLNYFQDGQEKRVIYFNDLQLGFEDIPMEVISKAEYEAHRNFRDKYDFKLWGIDYKFDATYSVDTYNYNGKFRPIELSKDLFSNYSEMRAIQLN